MLKDAISVKTTTEVDIAARLEDVVGRLLDLCAGLRLVSMARGADVQPGEPRRRADLVVEVLTPSNERYRLILEVKSSGEPRIARLAAGQLRSYVGTAAQTYGVFVAPYVSDSTRRVCSEENIGFVDLCGNCLLAFDGVYLSIEGRPNLYKTGRGLKSLFTPKASRCLRALLADPYRAWRVQDLKQEARVSLGQAYNVKSLLLAAELVNESGAGRTRRFSLVKPEELLREWAANYSYTRNGRAGYYSFDDPRTIERRLAQYCRERNIEYAFTLTSGAALVAPMLRYDTAFAYVAGDRTELAVALGLKPVQSGANVVLLEPYDEGVFYGVRDAGTVDRAQEGVTVPAGRVVSDVQLFLDLASYKGRGEEAAGFIMEQNLRPKWRRIQDVK